MDERLLFERIHEALDVDARPASYERMRTALIRHSSTPRRRAAFHMRWTKMGFRLAAAIVLVATAATVGAVFISTHRVAQQNVPAKLDTNTVAYQHMITSDDTALVQTYSNHCDTLADTGCVAALEHIKTGIQRWTTDLDSYRTPPSQFATIHQQVRTHLAAMSSDIDLGVAAFQAKDQTGMVDAVSAAAQESSWLGTTTVAISHARAASVADYVASVRGTRLQLEGCTFCQQLAGQSAASCATNPYPSCDLEVQTAKQTVAGLQSGDILLLPPASFTTRDIKLQADLAKADDAVIGLRKALLTGDQAGWDAQRAIFGRAWTAISNDISAISG